MADAKQCDRCGAFYTEEIDDKIDRKYAITKAPGEEKTYERDHCNKCYAAIEKVIDKDTKEKAKIRKQWSKESRQKASERMTKTMARLKEEKAKVTNDEDIVTFKKKKKGRQKTGTMEDIPGYKNQEPAKDRHY